jgi:hypothetical protein
MSIKPELPGKGGGSASAAKRFFKILGAKEAVSIWRFAAFQRKMKPAIKGGEARKWMR